MVKNIAEHKLTFAEPGTVLYNSATSEGIPAGESFAHLFNAKNPNVIETLKGSAQMLAENETAITPQKGKEIA